MESYKIKLIRTENPITGLLLNKSIIAIGHGLLGKSYSNNMLSITKKNKSTIHLNLDKYLRLEYSKELMDIIKSRAEQESGGVAKTVWE